MSKKPQRKSIPESDICEWYDIGWHYVGADACYGRCIIEWRSAKPAVEPLRNHDADQLLGAVASLEANAPVAEAI